MLGEAKFVIPGTAPEWIMGCYTPQALPVLSALATGFAVCDHWYCSAPTMTMPNRAFVTTLRVICSTRENVSSTDRSARTISVGLSGT